jgi:hypothetical protein
MIAIRRSAKKSFIRRERRFFSGVVTRGKFKKSCKGTASHFAETLGLVKGTASAVPPTAQNQCGFSR